MTLHRPPNSVVLAARMAHDLGLATWFGGAAMGAVALNAATREVEDPTQRNRVANAAWFRWAPYTALSIAGYLGGASVLRRGGRADLLPQRSRMLRAVDGVQGLATVVALAATLESGRSGQKVVRGGDVPVATAVQPISSTPPEVAGPQRRLRIVQWVMPASVATIWLANAVRDECLRGASSDR